MANKGAWFFDKNAAGEFVVSQAGLYGENLKIAFDLINGDRQDTHGEATESFGLIAKYWSIFLSQLTGAEVRISAMSKKT